MPRTPFLAILGVLALSYLPSPVLAEKNADPKNADAKVADPRTFGPATIKLEDIATIELPKDYFFVNEEFSKSLLQKQGSNPKGVLGIIFPKEHDNKNGFDIICRFDPIGHVKDDDAGKLNAAEILESIKSGTNEENENRKAQGIPPIYVGGWAETPKYISNLHEVVWAVEAKNKEDATAAETDVNYNTRKLGRKGVLSMNLISGLEQIDANKKKISPILASTAFTKGNAYEDFKPGIDKDSGLGIAGLILGGGAVAAAAKFGVFGALWKWGIAAFLILKKFLIVAVMGLFALFSRLFRKIVPKKDKPIE